jgi:hypothetical protein
MLKLDRSGNAFTFSLIQGTSWALRHCLADSRQEIVMGFGRGALPWLLGIPLPIILLLALFMHR